jgi:predicted transcriptional regulator
MANRRKEKPMIRVMISVDPDEYAEIEQMALCEERSTAWVIRKAMRDYIGRSGKAEASVSRA